MIIPARGAAATIGRTLSALRAQDLDEEFEVVVALDGPEDGTAEAVTGSGCEARLLPPPEGGKPGAGAARNRGAGAARGSLLAFTDADCEPTPSWLSRGLACLEDADLVQGAVQPTAGSEPGPFDHTVTVERQSGLFETANLLIRRDLFQRLGGFEDLLTLPTGSRPMGEDAWLGWRAHRAGARLAFCPGCLVRHAVIRRSAAEYVAEHARRVHFPALAKRIPELRRSTFFARCFLDSRTASFDAALLGSLMALARRSPRPLALALPYAAIASQRFSLRQPRTAKVLAADLSADCVSFVALVAGSARARALVL